MEADKHEERIPPNVLYHYCSVPTFFSILKNKSIWLSDISKSNDSLELMWIKDKCKYYILWVWYNYVNARKASALEPPDTSLFQKVQIMSDRISSANISKSWVFCLSEKMDNLGQWRGYADDASGVCIGFKTTFFETADEVAHAIDEDANLFFRRVRYCNHEIEDFFQNTARLSSVCAEMKPEAVVELLESAFQCTIWNAEFFKNEAFQEEAEWRLVFTMSKGDLLCGEKPSIPDPENRLISSDVFSFADYGYSVRNKSLVSHIEMRIPRIEEAITEIIIGPKSTLTKEDVELFLLSLGIDSEKDETQRIRITKSTISYR